MPNYRGVDWFNGQRVLEEDMGFAQESREKADASLFNDLWHGGIIKDPLGLSNFTVTPDATTQTLINIGWGTGYSPSGKRIAIDSHKDWTPTDPYFTTDGISTPQSTGSCGVPLETYDTGKPNFVWLEYLEAVRTAPKAISVVDGSQHFPYHDDGYKVVVNTTNPPHNPPGDAIFLATVFGQGASVALQPAPNGLTDYGREYAGTSQLNNGSVTPPKMDLGAHYTLHSACFFDLQAGHDLAVPLIPLKPTSAASRNFVEMANVGAAVSNSTYNLAYDGTGKLAFATISGENIGGFFPVYDGLCNIIQVYEFFNGNNVSHQINYIDVNGSPFVASVVENGY